MTPATEAGVAVPAMVPATAPRSVSAPVDPPSSVAPARARRLAEIGVVVTAAIWSLNFVVVKASIPDVGPLTFTGLRYIIATVTLFLLVRWRLGTVRIAPRLGLSLIGLGLLGFGCYQTVWTLGLTQITAGDSALIVALSPVLTAVIAGVIGMDRLTGPKLGGALIAFAGVALVITGGARVDLGASLLGDGLTLLAAVLWAVYTIIGTRLLRQSDPLQTAAWTVLGGTLMLVPMAIWESLTSSHVGLTPLSVAALLYSGAMAAGVSSILVFNAIRHIGPTRAAVGQFLVPAGAVALGALLLAEPVRLVQVVGGSIIVGGLWLTRQTSIVPAAFRARIGGW